MKNRLQFLHCNKLFPTAEKAKEFINNRVDANKQHALFAEPIVLKYGQEDDPNILLCIGSVGDGESAGNSNNKFFFIDAAEMQKQAQSNTVRVEDTDTVGMNLRVDENGTTISADVRVPETRIVNGVVKQNTIQKTDDGLFSLVDMDYDQDSNTLSLVINGETKVIALPAVLTGGTYEYTGEDAEKLVLRFNDGNAVKIDMSKLIEEWTVEGNNSATPVVLTKTHVKSNESVHGEEWQDVLSADVRIMPESLMSDNILKKSEDGRYLYVKGNAENITVWRDGVKMTLKDALATMVSKVSTVDGNIIANKSDGIYAKSVMSYDKASNTLSFDNGVEIYRFKLSGINFIDNVSYNSATETIIISYRNADGDIATISIPAKDIIEEWDVDNSTGTVELEKHRNVEGKDTLSANVRVANGLPHNILKVDSGTHGLYVNGESSNISYNETKTVKDVLDELASADATLVERIASVQSGVNSLSSRTDTLNENIEALRQDVERQSHEIDALELSVEDTDTVKMTKSPFGNGNKITSEVKLSQGDNIIVKENDGIRASIKFDYNEETNTITVRTSDSETQEIKLTERGAIKGIEYDSRDESLVITYYTYSGGSSTIVEERIPLKDLIEEWEVDNTNKTVTLNRERLEGGAPDKLSASVNLAGGDNAIVVKHEDDTDKLFVENIKPQVDAIETAVAELGENVETISDNVNTISGKTDSVKAELDSEVERLENEISEARESCALNFVDTNTVDFAKDGNNVSSNVVVSQSNSNIIKVDGNGISAEVDLEYIAGENKLRFKNSAMNDWKEIELAGIESVENVSYDSENKEIRLTIRLSGGNEKTISIPVQDLVRPWDVASGHEGAIILSKVENNEGVDILSATVVVDNNPTNILEKTNEGTLLVNGEQITTNQQNIASLSAAVEAISASSEGSSAALRAEVDRIETSVGLNQDGTFTPNPLSKHLSASTSLTDSDAKLEEAINAIESIIGQTGKTPTTTTYEKNGAMVSDVRLSGGKSDMTQDMMTMNRTQFEADGGENALRIVSFGDGYNPDVPGNGIFLSNIWDCGTFDN